jgi:hypothetical protein
LEDKSCRALAARDRRRLDHFMLNRAITSGNNACSAAWTLSVSDSIESSSSTRTAVWSIIGPPSTSNVTKWTVQPSAARYLHATTVRLANTVQAGKSREQRRMQIDDLPLEHGEKRKFQHAHKAGEDDQVGPARHNRRDVVLLGVSVEFRLIRGRIEKGRGDTKAWAKFEDAGVGSIRINLHDLAAPKSAVLLGLENRLGV